MRALMYLVITIMSQNGETTTHASQYNFANMRECRAMMEPVTQALVSISPQMGEEVTITQLECYPVRTLKVNYE